MLCAKVWIRQFGLRSAREINNIFLYNITAVAQDFKIERNEKKGANIANRIDKPKSWHGREVDLVYVCVFFTLNRSFYPSTSSTTSVRADSPILEEIQVMWSQSYATEILGCHVCSKHCSGQCNAMPSYY